MSLCIKTEYLEKEGEYIPVIVPKGPIDLAVAKKFKRTIAKNINNGQTQLVIVDLTNVPYMDCEGIGVLLGALKRIKENQGRIILIGLSSIINKMLRLVKLIHLFDIYSTLDEYKALALQ